MCGRYRLAGGIHVLRDIQAVTGRHIDAVSPAALKILAHDGIMRPYNDVPAIFMDRDGRLGLTPVYWQLIHYWCERFESKYTSFNTRRESLEKKHNAELLMRRRCLLPATAFFETRKNEHGIDIRPREAYEFSLKEGGVLMLGGIYSIWRNPKDRDDRRASCSIITMKPNEIVGEIHPRMPFVVSPEKCPAWLDRGLDDFDELMKLIEPIDSGRLVRVKEKTRS